MSEQRDRAVQSISLKTGCFHQPAFGFPQRAAESLAGKQVLAKPPPSAATRVTSHLWFIFHPVIPLSRGKKINKLANKQRRRSARGPLPRPPWCLSGLVVAPAPKTPGPPPGRAAPGLGFSGALCLRGDACEWGGEC